MIPWIDEQSPLPPAHSACGAESDWPGLVCAGRDLSAARLREAYSQGIYPWYSHGQPVLWWSPDPRMTLRPSEFKLRRSLRQRVKQVVRGAYEIRIDAQFDAVISACARQPRRGQNGTWITPAIRAAYTQLHRAGLAHSVETWREGRLVGGLYAVALGTAVFGESMFALESDASKIALAALVALCRAHAVRQIDCQQETEHLARMGARPIPRAEFLAEVALAVSAPPMDWTWRPVYWTHLLCPDPSA